MAEARGVPAPRPTRPAERTAAQDVAPALVASEHIFIGSDNLNPDPRRAGQTVRDHVELRNPLRRAGTKVIVFEEGFAQIVERGNGAAGEPFRLDLHYLDPIPSITRVIAKRALRAALGCLLATIVALLLAQWPVLRAIAVPAALLCASGALVAAAIALYRSHERTDFHTIHGRACVLSLVANFGSIKRYRAFVPVLSRAIEESAETITSDTSAYLRAEMREHYRLRANGILSNDLCAESTGRILAQFDIQI